MASPSTSARSAVEGLIEELRTRRVVVLDDLQRFRNELTVESLIPDAKAATTGALRIYRNELEELLNNPDLGPDRDEWLRRFADQAIARTALDPVSHPALSRVAKILVEMAEGQRRGSGYLVAPGWVLTTAHMVADATAVAVWLHAPEKQEPQSGAGVDPQRILLAADADLALLPVGQPSDGEVEPAPLAQLDRTGVDVVPAVAAGFPQFKRRPAPGRPEVLLLQELHLAAGTITVGSHRATDTLELAVQVVPAEGPQPDQHSPWEGMSGAAVWASDRLVGVVAQQHPRGGLGMLAVRPLAGLFEAVTTEQLVEWHRALPQLATLPSFPEALQRDQVEWLSDSPATHDLLKRAPLARALATRLRRLQKEEPRTSFLIHIDGPWGAGKSTLLNFLRDDLERDWMIVGFDAWRQSSIGPAWWALLAALRHDLTRGLGRSARARLRLAEGWHRIRHVGAPYLLALSVLLVVAAGVFLLLRPDRLASKATGDLIKTITAIVSALGTLWAGSLVAGRFLLWDSARGARLFEQSDTNPMKEVADHFGWLLGQVKRPVVFLIDDLDRCSERYVVELLDALQTLLRDAPRRLGREDTSTFGTFFLVAADGAWIRKSYEVAYGAFAESVAEPGRPLGYLFLDKLFQLTVPIPSLSLQAQATYFQQLLHASPAAGNRSVEAEAEAVQRRVEESATEAEVVETLRQATPAARHLVAEAAVAKLSAPKVEAATEHALQRFAPLLDPNPRSMKRFLNAYSVVRAVRTLEGNPIPREPLALWTILQTRWPSLADYLRRHPEAIEYIGEASRQGNTIPEQFQSLFDAPELRRLIAFNEGTPLTAELVRVCCGISAMPEEQE